MKILQHPNPILEKKALAVPVATGKKTVKDLLKAIEDVTWGTPVGMAAPQIGRSQRVFVALGEGFINPEILHIFRFHEQTSLEGCYSLPERHLYKVERPYGIVVKWTDIDGEQQEQRFNGEMARVIQHEMDHLEGMLCNGGKVEPDELDTPRFQPRNRAYYRQKSKNRLFTKKGYRKGVKV